MMALPIKDESIIAVLLSSGVRGGASHGITDLCIASLAPGEGFLLIDDIIE